METLHGGRKHEKADVLLRHGHPNFSNPLGTHGVMQMPADNLDIEIIKAQVRSKFFREAKHPGIGFDDIHFHVLDNRDGTVEIAFEVQN